MKRTKLQLREIIREEVQSLGESLDPKADKEQQERELNYLARTYDQIKSKRVDSSHMKKDVIGLLSQNLKYQEFINKFNELYPIVTTNSSWKGIRNTLGRHLNFLWNQDQAIRRGDTSTYGYRHLKFK